jgi:hypothetical protein
MITAWLCNDCDDVLMVRSFLAGSDRDWFMLRDRVWRAATRGSPHKRFLCVTCTERRLDRRLTAKDFRRNARVNFVGRKSRRLKLRMRGLEPAKHLIETQFVPGMQ